ncbi:MAG TPA: MFS transporter [Acidimicrobiia bacterium]|jgi:EmrB/QacA subfamily drug resistance transporter
MHDATRLHRHHDDVTVSIAAPRRRLALVVLCLCALTTAIDITITNVALPAIGKQLDAPTSELQWVVDAYNIVLAGLLVLGGGLADRYGRRRVFLIGYALFGLACLLAAMSTTTETLIAARALMGVGAAGVVAPALAIIAGLYAPEERAGAIGLWAVFGAAGLAIGPVMGGLLLDHFWWGSVFLVNVPLVALGVVVGLGVIPESRVAIHGALDVLGAALSVGGLAVLLFGVIEGPERGWTSPEVIGALVVGALVLVAFVRREVGARFPLFDVRIAVRPAVAAGAVTLFVAYIVFTGMLFVLPQYLTDVSRESIVDVGLLLVPFAATFGVLSLRAGAAVARFGARAAITVGLATNAVAMVLLALVVHDDVLWTVLATMVAAAGLSLLIAPASTVMMNGLPPEKAGDGSSFSMVSRFVGAAVGVAIVGSVFAAAYAAYLPGASGPPPTSGVLDAASRDAFAGASAAGYLVIGGFAALAAVVSWLVLRGEAGRAD